jgi:hypothetical protein
MPLVVVDLALVRLERRVAPIRDVLIARPTAVDPVAILHGSICVGELTFSIVPTVDKVSLIDGAI